MTSLYRHKHKPKPLSNASVYQQLLWFDYCDNLNETPRLVDGSTWYNCRSAAAATVAANVGYQLWGLTISLFSKTVNHTGMKESSMMNKC